LRFRFRTKRYSPGQVFPEAGAAACVATAQADFAFGKRGRGDDNSLAPLHMERKRLQATLVEIRGKVPICGFARDRFGAKASFSCDSQ
jgi:hypothetical protein